ncbi:LysR substrate-binding domain-containing protein [Amycolatopsis methanolica]|uniref:LysR substrate-binding domain-containing protein n=1 Tax=Amycolatopsis methanolica TaxID=1814 RepID=UPI00039FEE10|nr:LysR substrate-binding domain-containing protein [Amycolatopsis methanolica]
MLLEHADSLFAQWERARADLSVGEEAGTVRMCGVSSTVAALLGPAVTRLRREHPRLTARLIEEESADCYELLLAEAADIAVVLPTPEVTPSTTPLHAVAAARLTAGSPHRRRASADAAGRGGIRRRRA